MIDSSALGQAIVFDQAGVMQVPNRPYAVVDSAMQQMAPPLSPTDGPGWRTVEEMTASLRKNAPEPKGLPDGAPNPNTVYLKDGQYVRYVVDTSEPTERYVAGGQVRERIKFSPRMVSLTLKGARASNAAGNRCDYWNGFTWIRDGYIPERDFPVMVQQEQRGVAGQELVFEQPVSPNDEAVIRHQVAHLERSRPTLPVETADTLSGEVKAVQSVPFPEATSVVPDGSTPTTDFAPEPEKRGPGRPRKDEV